MKKSRKILITIIIIIVIAIVAFFINYKIDFYGCCSCCDNLESGELCLESCCRCTKIIKR